MNNQLLDMHCYNFNPKDNSGESLSLTTKIFANGDPGGIYLNQTITLNSYDNSASINLCGINITPDILRKLAQELELRINTSKEKIL